MVHAARNPMAIKRANDSTFEAQIDQARKGLTPRRARKVGAEGIDARLGSVCVLLSLSLSLSLSVSLSLLIPPHPFTSHHK